MKKYQIIYCDPPWSYNQKMHQDAGLTPSGKKKQTTHVTDHYPTMNDKELLDMKESIESISADDCLLFMWTTGTMLEFSIRLGLHWGFKYITIAYIWNKEKYNPGNYTMSCCELCIIFKKGKIPQPRGIRNSKQFLSIARGRHSEKPAFVRDEIVKMFPTQQKIELFARQKPIGWDIWGNELTNSIEL